MMELQVIKHRAGLTKLKEALNNKKVTLGFIGGSITDSRGVTRWPEYVIRWFADRFPDVRFYAENAAIGATGSDLAVFRAERDLIHRDCDIVFIEFAVNDGGVPTERRMRTREGLIRKLLRDERRDLVIVYTFSQDMYADMINGEYPPSIKEFEQLADYYKIGSVWMGLNALNEVKRGLMTWEEWLPDGLHPESRGSLSYAQSVIQYLENEIGMSPELSQNVGELPEPLNAHNWENTYMVPFEEMELQGPWFIRRSVTLAWVDQVLETNAISARLSFDFTGRGLSLGFDFGKSSSEFRYRLDGADWIDVSRDRPWWCGDSGWFSIYNFGDDMPAGKHHIEIEVTHGNKENCKGTNFKLGFAGVIK